MIRRLVSSPPVPCIESSQDARRADLPACTFPVLPRSRFRFHPAKGCHKHRALFALRCRLAPFAGCIVFWAVLLADGTLFLGGNNRIQKAAGLLRVDMLCKILRRLIQPRNLTRKHHPYPCTNRGVNMMIFELRKRVQLPQSILREVGPRKTNLLTAECDGRLAHPAPPPPAPPPA